MSGQPRLDRDLLRYLWRESGSAVGYQQWRAQKLSAMAEYKRAEEERQRQLHGPWTQAEWSQWQKTKDEERLEEQARRLAEEAQELEDRRLTANLLGAVKRHRTEYAQMKEEETASGGEPGAGTSVAHSG